MELNIDVDHGGGTYVTFDEIRQQLTSMSVTRGINESMQGGRLQDTPTNLKGHKWTFSGWANNLFTFLREITAPTLRRTTINQDEMEDNNF